jgi:hypothetical protein
MITCKHCDRVAKSVNSNVQHEIRCKENPNKIIVKFQARTGVKRVGYVGSNQYTKAKRLGLPTPTISDETRKKISDASKNQQWSEERRVQHSRRMKQAVEENPESYTSSNRGRTKQIEYNGIKFQGQWELDFYKWAEKEGLEPTRPDEGFKYDWNGIRTYFPDFYIPSMDLYIEVKGYETERDRAKWLQFPKSLCIIKEREIKQIRNNCFRGL